MTGKPIFLNKIKKTGRHFQKSPEISTRGTKTNVQNRHTRKQLVEKVSIRKHNDCSLIVLSHVLYLDVENFEGGKLKYYYEHWKKYTSDTFILEIIKNGLKLDLNEILFQHCCNNFPLSKEEMSIINSEVQKLKSKKVIVNKDKEQGITFLVYLPEVKKMVATG